MSNKRKISPYLNGYTLVNDGKYKEALELANSYLYFDKKWYQSGRDIKAYCLFKMGKYEESFDILDKRLLFDPKDYLALSLKANRLSLIWRHREATKLANKFIRIAKKDSRSWKLYEAYWIKALVLYHKWEYKQSIRYYRESLKSKPLNRSIKSNAKIWIERCKSELKST